MNHDELRMTTKVEVRQDSLQVTTRDRITASDANARHPHGEDGSN
jgi:hypothetical protein